MVAVTVDSPLRPAPFTKIPVAHCTPIRDQPIFMEESPVKTVETNHMTESPISTPIESNNIQQSTIGTPEVSYNIEECPMSTRVESNESPAITPIRRPNSNTDSLSDKLERGILFSPLESSVIPPQNRPKNSPSKSSESQESYSTDDGQPPYSVATQFEEETFCEKYVKTEKIVSYKEGLLKL